MLTFPSFNLYLIRHGQSESNLDPDRMGQTPYVPLTELGKNQALLLGKKFKESNVALDLIYSSPYVRALDTALIVNKFYDKEIFLDENLREYDPGDWKGTSRKEIVTDDIKLLMGYFTNAFMPPNGESLNAVERRASQWLDENIMCNSNILQASDAKMKLNQQPLEIACFSHGMTIKCLLHYIIGFDKNFTWKISIDNTSVTKLSFDHEGWKLRCVNDTAHLGLMNLK